MEQLQALDARVNAALLQDDVSGYMASNRALHFAVYRAANAPTLMRIAEELWLRIGPSMRFVFERFGGMIPANDYHAVGSSRPCGTGDADGFTTAMASDIAQGLSEIRRHIETTQTGAP